MDKTYYLVGSCWYSGDQGDFPNNFHFPTFISESLEEAERMYEEKAKEDDTWGYGCKSAYLISYHDGKYKMIRGYKNQILDLVNITFTEGGE